MKRDLWTWQLPAPPSAKRRPTRTNREQHGRKETYKYEKRPTHTQQTNTNEKRPTRRKKTNKYEKKPTHTKRDQHKRSETYTYEKGRTCAKKIYKRDLHIRKETRENVQHTATHCNTLQHTATHCNTRATACSSSCKRDLEKRPRRDLWTREIACLSIRELRT